jgi:hypothetical protein
MTEAERAAVAAGYQSGQTIRELAAAFEVSRATVGAVLEEYGVRRRYRVMGPAELARASELYAAGWSFARVGQELGVDGKTVYNAFVRAGLPTRPRVGR